MILVDTHVVVWLAFDQEKISRNARRAIDGARQNGTGLAISDISLLELATLASKGRIRLDISLESFLQEVESRFVVLPISGRACVRAIGLPATYPKDPADRIIGATALVEGLSLLTADLRSVDQKRLGQSGEGHNAGSLFENFEELEILQGSDNVPEIEAWRIRPQRRLAECRLKQGCRAKRSKKQKSGGAPKGAILTVGNKCVLRRAAWFLFRAFEMDRQATINAAGQVETHWTDQPTKVRNVTKGEAGSN